jgi:hypothetical protein
VRRDARTRLVESIVSEVDRAAAESGGD